MTDLLPRARLGHFGVTRKTGDAAHRVLSPQDFAATANAEIMAWESYEPTPPVSLPAAAGLADPIAARADSGLSEKLGLDPASRVLLIGSEGVTDPAVFRMIMGGRDAA